MFALALAVALGLAGGAAAADSLQQSCDRIVTYNAGYFLTEGYDDYPFFMGFIDVTPPARSPSTGDLVGWSFANNETLISVTPEALTEIESDGERDGGNASRQIQVETESDHFKFIAHREQGDGLDPPRFIELNGVICEEIAYTDVVGDPDETVRATAHSREIAEGAFNEQEPSVLVFYQPDQESLDRRYPKTFTEFNFSVVNTGTKPLDVATVKVKYFFQNPAHSAAWSIPDGESWEVTFSDCMEVYGSFHDPNPVSCGDLGVVGEVRPLTVGDQVDGADYVLEISFKSDPHAWLAPLDVLGNPMVLDEDTGERRYNTTSPTGILAQAKLQLDSRDFGFFLPMNETGDYSFRPPSSDRDWIINQNMTVEVNNETIWGTDLEAHADSKRFNVMGGGQLGIPGANCNGNSGGGGQGGVGCMVTRRYCCGGEDSFPSSPQEGESLGGSTAEGVLPMHPHEDHATPKVWMYALIGVLGLALLAGVVIALVLFRRRRLAASASAAGGDEPKGEAGGSTGSNADRFALLSFFSNPLHHEGGASNPQESLPSLEKPLKRSSSTEIYQSSLRELSVTGIPDHKLDGRLSITDLNASSGTPTPDPSPTSALGSMSIFRNPFAVLPQSPKLPLPNVFRNSSREESLFELINPDDVKPIRYIGSGAYGSVYEAKFQDRGRVAVKLVNIRETSSKTLLESFKREVDVLSRVKHQNVVRLHGASMCPPNVFIVMELLQGSLRDHLDEAGAMPYREILVLANEISSALAYLHPTIVHRDLKPQNILMDKSGSAKVADFGIAKFKQSTYLQTTKGNGTPAYMAPESFGSEKISEKADVFSLGMILWECWTGQQPWKEVQIPFQVVMLVGVEKKRPAIPEDCPKQLASLIQRCWDDDPHRRPSCAEVERRTRLLLHELEEESGR